MSTRFYDGRSARSHAAEAIIDGDVLRIVAEGRESVWSIKDLVVEVEADQARVSNRREPDARLVLPVGDWSPMVGDRLTDHVKRRRHREWWLIGGLTAAAAGVALFILVGVPGLSRPLAPPGWQRTREPHAERLGVDAAAFG